MEEQEAAKRTCESCKHFYRHYIRTGSCLYIPLDDGYCGDPQRRSKQADTPACHRHAARPTPKKEEKRGES